MSGDEFGHCAHCLQHAALGHDQLCDECRQQQFIHLLFPRPVVDLEQLKERRSARRVSPYCTPERIAAGIEATSRAQARASVYGEQEGADAAEQEGITAGLSGCVGTHNPHLFGDTALRDAWERGNARVRAVRDEGHQQGKRAAELFAADAAEERPDLTTLAEEACLSKVTLTLDRMARDEEWVAEIEHDRVSYSGRADTPEAALVEAIVDRYIGDYYYFNDWDTPELTLEQMTERLHAAYREHLGFTPDHGYRGSYLNR